MYVFFFIYYQYTNSSYIVGDDNGEWPPPHTNTKPGQMGPTTSSSDGDGDFLLFLSLNSLFLLGMYNKMTPMTNVNKVHYQVTVGVLFCF
jgi:hypothetical protein